MTPEIVQELRAKLAAATPGEWEFQESHGRDCVWLDVVVDNDEILSAETMPQEHIVHASSIEAVREQKEQSVANLEFIAAAHNYMSALLDALEQDELLILAHHRECPVLQKALQQAAEIERLKAALAEVEKRYVRSVAMHRSVCELQAETNQLYEQAIARAKKAESALREIADASKASVYQLGTDSEGNCTLVDCRCSNHIARAAIRAAKEKQP